MAPENTIMLGFLRYLSDCWEEEKRRMAETHESLEEIEDKLKEQFANQ